jgi:hypothetical protein
VSNLRVVVAALFLVALAVLSTGADARRDVDDAEIARSSAALFRALGDAALAGGDRNAAKSWRDTAAEGERTASSIARPATSTATSGSVAGIRRDDVRVSEANKRAIAYARDLAALLLAKAASLEDQERASHAADYDSQRRGGTTPR